MHRLHVLLCLLLSTTFLTKAQNAPQPPGDSTVVIGHCLLEMQENEWAALGLSAEQVEQVRGIQTQCETDCAVRSTDGQLTSLLSVELVKQHLDRMAKVLTPEQFKKWAGYCHTREAKGQIPR